MRAYVDMYFWMLEIFVCFVFVLYILSEMLFINARLGSI